MRIVFLGTPEFAVPSLEALVRSGHDVPAVFTQPDRPKGRGNQLAESPVKRAAWELGLAVSQPERVRRSESVESLRVLAPDLMVVVGYGQIIPQKIIDIPRYGILNVHGSLLPKYRGAAPIQWAIANGEKETGVTIMQIDAGLDTGDMLAKKRLAIGDDETAPKLGARMALLGAEVLAETIKLVEQDALDPEKQDDAEATLAPILGKEDGRIDWNRTAFDIYNRLRGFSPWPGAYTTFRGQPVNLTAMRPLADVFLTPGTFRVEKGSLLVGCGAQSAVQVVELQPAGKKRMTAEAFMNGYRPQSGELFSTVDEAENNR